MAAENYHLKWDSHLTYLNTSVATLYKNEKFADVVLYSSNTNSNGNSDIPTVGISAHKFILSSCSQFFATMFETAPITAPNGVLYIVLPPDLSHRAIQILVQYMYSGEATVSNDILNEVLRGGEILKIRGLCRTGPTSSSQHAHTSHMHHHHHHHHHQRETNSTTTTHYSTNGSSTRNALTTMSTHTELTGDIYVNKRYSIEPQHHQQQFRGLGASVMPKDSPVIVKSPKLTHSGLLTTTSSKHHITGGITVNKEVAIDPEDKCCYQAQQQQIGLHTSSLPQTQTQPQLQTQPMSICTEVGCNSCTLTATTGVSGASIVSADLEPLRRRQRSNRNDVSLLEREYNDRSADEAHTHCEDTIQGIVFERRMPRETTCELRDYFPSEHYDSLNTKPYVDTAMTAAAARLPTPPHRHNFLSIKEEPADWSNSAPTNTNENSNEPLLQQRSTTPMLQSPKQPLDFKMPLGSAAVKLETNVTSCNTDEDEHKLQNFSNYKLLICEICQKSFDDTKSLVRHIETHNNIESNHNASTSTSNIMSTSNGTSVDTVIPKTYVPKKRRRISQQENNMDHVTLLCDLCTTSFETPAEWVRHMNNQHTEIELAMFNNKKDGEQKNSSNNSNTSNNNDSINGSSSSTTSSSSSHNQPQPQTHKKYTIRQTVLLNKRSSDATSSTASTTNAANGNESKSSNQSTSSMPTHSNTTNIQCDQLNTTPSHA